MLEICDLFGICNLLFAICLGFVICYLGFDYCGYFVYCLLSIDQPDHPSMNCRAIFDYPYRDFNG